MAPTEILASQHYSIFKKFFPKFSGGAALLTSSNAKVFYGDGLETELNKKDLIKKIASGEVKIIVGTHSLISSSGGQRSVSFKNLALVMIDEQHRFGVKQRAQLTGRKDGNGKILPHFLSMSATPIPRTLSITIFGDLELSIIDELPKNRKPVITKAVVPSNRDKAYAFIRGQVKKGRQVFVICPRIEKEELIEEGKLVTDREIARLETKNVKEEYEKLSKKVFPDLKVEALHGRMKAKEKNETMKKFSEGKTDILVSTSVVEVGVDIPNATIMMVEGAERFGLAQLYQFRGRVGRGEHQSFCFLFSDAPGKNTRERLNSLMTAKNGFELAEKDLEIRGPGEFLGSSQTGVPDLAMKAVQNPELLKSSRESAEEILEKDPELKNSPLLKIRLEKFEKEVHLE
jgi:ATP-dependent DNA helicase RecG